ncbi:MAG: heme exporter protein CcmD [Coxiella sp. RIFCSPHIGHO2_12_FULL_44_14]|nr:MAG: heme exporter protein CcmD [Coxiella sp. RIFCSPHIGHO2_12_FULL_44_14]
MNAWWHMGGYAVYVWTAYGVVIAVLLLLSAVVWIRWHRLWRELRGTKYRERSDVNQAPTTNI